MQRINTAKVGSFYLFGGLTLLGSGIVLNGVLLSLVFGDGELSPVLTIVSHSLSGSVMICGFLLVFYRCQTGLHYAVIVGIWCIAGLLSITVGFEIAGELTDKRRARDGEAVRWSTYAPYREFYANTNAKQLHPFYFFFHEFSPNPVVSLSQDKFRGHGPGSSRLEGKRLAFILGGSGVFGHGASSNDTTISGFLNELTDEYFVVNAGVNSWTSLQEFYRLALELVQYDPELIIVYDGYNDAITNFNYRDRGYPVGTVESYDKLEQLIYPQPNSVGFQRKQTLKGFVINKVEYYNEVFYRIIKRERKNTGDELLSGDQIPLPKDEALGAIKGANNYLKHLMLMKSLGEARGVRMMFIWQPNLYQHKKVSKVSQGIMDYQHDRRKRSCLAGFHGHLFENSDKLGEHYDFPDYFDQHFEEIKLGSLFIDSVHITDDGNRLVAEGINNLILGRSD